MPGQQFGQHLHRRVHRVEVGTFRTHQVPFFLPVDCFKFQHKPHVLHDLQGTVGVDERGLHLGVVHAQAPILAILCTGTCDTDTTTIATL